MDALSQHKHIAEGGKRLAEREKMKGQQREGMIKGGEQEEWQWGTKAGSRGRMTEKILDESWKELSKRLKWSHLALFWAQGSKLSY